MNPVMSVIIPVYRQPEAFRRCLRAVIGQEYPPEAFEVIVVDDGRQEEIRAITRECGAGNVRYVQGAGGNVSAARNLGGRLARGGILAFTDQDCVVSSGWLSAIAACFTGDAGSDACGAEQDDVIVKGVFKGIGADGPATPSEGYLFSPGFAPLKTIPAANLAVRAEAFAAMKGFDERFRWGGEDCDLQYRLLAAGFRVRYEPAMRVTHYTRDGLRQIAHGMFVYGYCDTLNMRDHFKGWCVLDLAVAKLWKRQGTFLYLTRFPVTCCFRLDLLKIAAGLAFLSAAAPLLGAAVAASAALMTAFYGRKHFSVHLLYNLYNQFWYLCGHVAGSVRNRVFYL